MVIPDSCTPGFTNIHFNITLPTRGLKNGLSDQVSRKKVTAAFLNDAFYTFRRLTPIYSQQMYTIPVDVTEFAIKEFGNTRLLVCCVPNGHYESDGHLLFSSTGAAIGRAWSLLHVHQCCQTGCAATKERNPARQKLF
jgi:hypothetical protein